MHHSSGSLYYLYSYVTETYCQGARFATIAVILWSRTDLHNLEPSKINFPTLETLEFETYQNGKPRHFCVIYSVLDSCTCNITSLAIMALYGRLLLLLTITTALEVHSQSDLQSEKRYAILDNDWLAVGFLPFLLAMKGGMEVLGLASGRHADNVNLCSWVLIFAQILAIRGRSSAACMLWRISRLVI